MFPVGFEPTISAGELPQTCALDRLHYWAIIFYFIKIFISRFMQ